MSNQWICAKIYFKIKLSNVINESRIKLFDILLRLCADLLFKRIGRVLLNKHDAVTEEVVDNKELMECMRGDPIIYVRSSKDFKIAWKKKNS